MASTATERPTFFEGQYLGADDLAAIVDYLRTQLARSSLGQHSWGIAIGLQLVSQDIGGGAVEYYVQPGVAVDGYGRLLVLTEPLRVDNALFVGIGSGETDVWLYYQQSERQGVRQGFEVCSAEDSYSRIAESAALAAGSLAKVSQRQAGVTINNTLVGDAREALNTVDPDAPIVCDGSIPQQQYPIDDEESYWLVPLGLVNWVSASNSFQALNEEQQIRSRCKRRNLGVVAEQILSANGIIRLRDRFCAADATKSIDEICEDFIPQSRDFYICDNQLSARELVWLEGSTRVTGDLRLFGTRLEFRDTDGADYVSRSVDGATLDAIDPLLIQRLDSNTAGGADLQVWLGSSSDGRNRFTIGASTVSGSDLCDIELKGVDHVVVQDDGKTAIGAVDSTLASPLTIRGIDPDSELLSFENASGNRLWHWNMGPGADAVNLVEVAADSSRLFVAAGGNVGLGNDDPKTQLHIKGDDPDLFLDINSGSANNLTELRLGEDGVIHSSFYWSKQTNRTYIKNEGVNAIIIDQEKVGLGTPDPMATLHIATGSDVNSNDNSGFLVIGEEGNLNIGIDDNEIQARNSNSPSTLHLQVEGGDLIINKTSSRVIVKDSGDVGINTSTPAAKLDVRGDIKLGSAGDLYAVSSREKLHIVSGRINSNGSTAQGSGFICVRSATGTYAITFTPPFVDDPVVVASSYNDNDNVASVWSVNAASCQVHLYDPDDGGLLNDQFTFIATGRR